MISSDHPCPACQHPLSLHVINEVDQPTRHKLACDWVGCSSEAAGLGASGWSIEDAYQRLKLCVAHEDRP